MLPTAILSFTVSAFRRAIFVSLLFGGTTTFAQHDHGGHHAQSNTPIKKPRVFLDKSPRVVAFQLKRLSNAQLLLVDRSAEDPKYAPVYSAILTRAGMTTAAREEALAGLVQLNNSNATLETIKAFESFRTGGRQEEMIVKELASLLLRNPKNVAATKSDLIVASNSDNVLTRRLGFAVLASLGEVFDKRALSSDTAAISLANCISWLPKQSDRDALRPILVELLDRSTISEVRSASVQALGYTSAEKHDTFARLAPLIIEKDMRPVAVQAMLKTLPTPMDPVVAGKLAGTLVTLAESTPAAERTSNEFIDAMQLADKLLTALPLAQAKSYRARLNKVTVRVVRVRTVLEEMRYDTRYFAVEAGRPVQVVLENVDLMPHNLVIVNEGQLQRIAELALSVGPEGGWKGLPYVPEDKDVLQATDMVGTSAQVRLTFNAPTKPGSYPYVCTFPRHWMRMYGVMVVVDDLDAWLKNPVTPKDPIGSQRTFVKSWKLDDLSADLEQGVRDRSANIGQRIFTEATCAQCHQADGVGGKVGPPLNGVFTRWKKDSQAVLREILEPSHRIEPKYTMHQIITNEGKTISGLIASEDKNSVSLIVNPESDQLSVVRRDQIEEMLKTPVSMMPKGLMNQFTKEEIFELMAYLKSLK